MGEECQRLQLDLFHRFSLSLYPYHMSTYSFAEDLILIKTNGLYFCSISRVKGRSFMGSLKNVEFNEIESSVTFFPGSQSLVWHLGGTNVMSHTAGFTATSKKLTRLIDLR